MKKLVIIIAILLTLTIIFFSTKTENGFSLLPEENQSERIKPDFVELRNQNGDTVKFNVEIADDRAERMKGLMDRKSLEKKTGMLFIFPKEEEVNMWMKDTYIPLDMAFIDSKGIIVNIAKNNQPEDLTTISSILPVIAVLEVNAGELDQHTIKKGDMLLNINNYIE